MKVEELLRGLLGGIYEDVEGKAKAKPPARNPEDRHWGNETDMLCGWPRRELLKGVILILGKTIRVTSIISY